jgi:hypothetical protein
MRLVILTPANYTSSTSKQNTGKPGLLDSTTLMYQFGTEVV